MEFRIKHTQEDKALEAFEIIYNERGWMTGNSEFIGGCPQIDHSLMSNGIRTLKHLRRVLTRHAYAIQYHASGTIAKYGYDYAIYSLRHNTYNIYVFTPKSVWSVTLRLSPLSVTRSS